MYKFANFLDILCSAEQVKTQMQGHSSQQNFKPLFKLGI